MARMMSPRTKRTVKDTAKRGARAVKSVAGEALSAAARAAAGVVLESTVDALERGRTKVSQSTPSIKRAVGKAAKRTVTRAGSRQSPKSKKTAVRKRRKRRSQRR
jgi:hypothetical protein